MSVDLASLAGEIHRQASLQGIPEPGITRLVKIVYLADLEWRRFHDGEPIAPLSWRFHHFGPYADEFTQLTGEVNAEMAELNEGRFIKRISFSGHNPPVNQVPEAVSSLVARLVKEWGSGDLNSLLNYVYFETEPMENARRGGRLDFTGVTLRREIVLRLDGKKMRDLRSRLNQRVHALGLTRSGLHFPALDLEVSGPWDDEIPARLPEGAIVTFAE